MRHTYPDEYFIYLDKDKVSFLNYEGTKLELLEESQNRERERERERERNRQKWHKKCSEKVSGKVLYSNVEEN